MKMHVWYAWGWVGIILLFIAWEVVGLLNRFDEYHPFTFYVRKVVGTWTSPVWWLAAGFILWMLIHFLFVHSR